MAVTMTPTFTPGVDTPNASHPNFSGTFPGPNPYTVGGESADFETDFGVNVADIKSGSGRAVGSDHFCIWDSANGKWIIYVGATGVEAGAVNLSASVFHFSALRGS